MKITRTDHGELDLAGGHDHRVEMAETKRHAAIGIDPNELIIDAFCGCGGMSVSVQEALNRPVDVAINHWDVAIGTHAANHPDTKHYRASIYALDPRDLVPAGRTVGLLWASPDCREFSRAKNGKPRSPSIRMLADSVIHYAQRINPRVIGIENVIEFMDAGPLDDKGRIIKAHKGDIFRRWIGQLEDLGYSVEWKILNAANFGAPTLRTRFFLQARRDGLPITWPEPTHGDPTGESVINGQLLPWRTAAECLDFSLPVKSIFLTKEEGKLFNCRRPLADSTLRRIARGIFRDVLSSEKPFIVTYYGEKKRDEGFRGSGLDRPLATATAGGNRFGLVVPLTHHGSDRVYSLKEPFRTITGANRGELAYVAASMIQTGYGEREGQAPRTLDLGRPLGTVVATGVKHAVVAATLTCFNQNARGSTPARPLGTVMAGATRHAYVESSLEGGPDRSAEVAEFLWQHRDLSKQPVTRDADGRIRVAGVLVEIIDIGLRMLDKRELARAQGFNDDPANGRVFDASHQADGTPNTGEDIIKMIGNSVSPPMGTAIIRSMFGVEQGQIALAA